ncbi:carboxypeptidase-like regulatory domain-containing protein [Bacteroides sp. OttesenSCG-928-E20]|nr:carboxypeptidase-like regulatory domain-containing protein [Bacteroides sp. OttesenSCG-928-E20]
MKKTVHHNATLCLYICWLLLGVATTVYADEGDVLNRVLKFPHSKGTKYQLLRQVTDETGFLFIYDSAVMDNDKEISIPEGEYTLRNLIFIIAETRQLDIVVVGNHIALSLQTDAHKAPSPPLVETEKLPYTIITGQVFDLFSKEKISSATVSITGGNMGTVTNKDGLFRLALPDSLYENTIRISHVGYENREFTASTIKDRHIDLLLEPKVIPLQEVVIRVMNPHHLITKMMDGRPDNYATQPALLTTFYREGVEHKKKNVDLSEAVLQIYKTGYQRENVYDQAKLLKKRRIVDRQERDTMLTKVKSGVRTVLMLDLMKYVPDFLTLNFPNEYDYAHTDISVVDNRLVNVVSFEQKKIVKDPLFKGALYIDAESSALLEARFELNPQYVEKATHLFVEKQSRNFKLKLRKADYAVSYRPSTDGVYYLNHVRGDLEFRVRRRRQLFSSTLKVWFELVNCQVQTENIQSIPRAERISTRTVFSEITYNYDADFWQNFNIIVPEEGLKEFIVKQTMPF